ncbi:hypothetical protein RRG08_022748 [Elysia crispata]|uniref:Uncharacterized protein n=1 Tax=Elysia crispata TaxID=231223 RepID=A0AAE1DPH7_9GAST|nr:hypothetical protein RRG08_022748 [Elysia crispata]
MYRPFKEQNDLQVSFSLHYSVYSRRFNLGFGRPATNVCSTCAQFRSRVRNGSQRKKKKVMAVQFILHHRRAKQLPAK